MTALYIILAITAFLLFLLFLPIRVYISYNGNICVYLSVLFFRFPLYPRKKKSTSKKRRKRKTAQASASEQAPKEQKKGFSYYLSTFRLFLRVLKKVEVKLRGAFKIEIKEMYASVATGDAASTAIVYGVLSQGFSYALALADNFLKTKYSAKNICVIPSFTGSDTEFKFKIKLICSSNLLLLLRVGIHTLFTFYTEKTKQKNTVPTEENENG